MSSPSTHVHVPAGHGRTFEVRSGQFITVIDRDGQQAADFVAIVNGAPEQYLSPTHTRRRLDSLFFAVGDSLYSNADEPLLTILHDTVGVHDANVPACDCTRFSVDFGVDGHRNCLDNMHEGLSHYGVLPVNVPEPFNLFQNGPVTPPARPATGSFSGRSRTWCARCRRARRTSFPATGCWSPPSTSSSPTKRPRTLEDRPMLLMKDATETRAPLPMQSVTVPAASAGSMLVKRGQLLRITAREDGAVASLFGFSEAEPTVHLSVHHTRVFSNSYVLGAGMRLVNNRRRPVMVLGKDSVGQHDLLMPASTTAFLAANGYEGQPGCVEALVAELQRLNRQQPKLPDPINLFMNVQLDQQGTLTPQPNTVKAGDSVTCRVVLDTVFVVSTCCTGIAGNDKPGAVELSVAEDLSDFPA
jgi:uncharacterized protein YcgI (DUF1989 family)